MKLIEDKKKDDKKKDDKSKDDEGGEDLETLYNRLNALKKQTPAVQRLIADLLNDYYLPYKKLGDREREAWDDLLVKRLQWICQREDSKAITPLLALARAAREGKENVRQVHFGQLRAAASYQSSFTIHSAKEVAGKLVTEVAQDIAEGGIARDQLTVKIFWAKGVWVTVNNRSLAAYSLAAAVPIRLIPCLASKDELNRLSEVEDLKVAPKELQFKSDKERFAEANLTMPSAAETMLSANSLPKDRTLPSNLLPLTPGPEDKRVLGVVKSVMS